MSPRIPWPYIWTLVLCSVVDWALTVDALALDMAAELNPVITKTLEQGIGFTLLYKLAWVVVGVVLLHVLGKGSKLSTWGIRILACAYAGVVLYQCFARLFVL